MYLEKLRLDGRVALITGGAQGIGLACAQALGEAGARVVIADLDRVALDAGNATLAKQGVECSTLLLDVTSSAQVDGAAKALIDRESQIDIYETGVESSHFAPAIRSFDKMLADMENHLGGAKTLDGADS